LGRALTADRADSSPGSWVHPGLGRHQADSRGRRSRPVPAVGDRQLGEALSRTTKARWPQTQNQSDCVPQRPPEMLRRACRVALTLRSSRHQ